MAANTARFKEASISVTINHPPKAVIVTGASQGIGAGIVRVFLARGYNVVGTARNATKSRELSTSDHLALIDGDIGQFETAQKVAKLALKKFGSIDAVVANAGIFLVKPFTEYTAEDFRALVSTNLAGFIYIAQLAVKQMQVQKSGGSIVSISAALADNPTAGVPASVPMITKGGLNAIIGSLALEYAKEHIRFNVVAPGVVDTPLRKTRTKLGPSRATLSGSHRSRESGYRSFPHGRVRGCDHQRSAAEIIYERDVCRSATDRFRLAWLAQTRARADEPAQD